LGHYLVQVCKVLYKYWFIC